MPTILNVNTGEVKVGRWKSVLKAPALGSCIAVIVYNKVKKIGGMVHIMLPGRAPHAKRHNQTRYAQGAIDALLARLECFGVCAKDLDACLVGAGNVLKQENDTVCGANIESVMVVLRDKGVRVVAQDLGGDQRRSVCLDIAAGNVYFTRGDGRETLLWSF